MLSKVINYILSQPTPTTSPVYLVANDAAMVSLLGQEAKVYRSQNYNAYDAEDRTMTPPYVRFMYSPQIVARDQFLGGAHRGYVDMQELLLECMAYASTDYEAETRAESLAGALEQAIQGLLGTFQSGSISVTNPITGDLLSKVVSMRCLPPQQRPLPSGPGEDNHWTCVRYVRIQVDVFSSRNV